MNRIHNRALNELIDPSLGYESYIFLGWEEDYLSDKVSSSMLATREGNGPTMDEFWEALKEIKGYKDDNIGEIIHNKGRNQLMP